MKQVDIKIEKTARYFLSGEPNDKIKTVWFVCHGYGQLASYFLNWFHPVINEENLVVAPEGLHRFYWNGFSGNVVASWMTKEDRTTDIADYVSYLDKVSKEVLQQLPENVNVNIVGFSQGTGTVCRWVTQGTIKADNLALWAGTFPEDVNSDIFNSLNLTILLGDQDSFYSEENLQKEFNKFKEKGLSFDLIRFKGGHKVLPGPLLELAEKFS